MTDKWKPAKVQIAHLDEAGPFVTVGPDGQEHRYRLEEADAMVHEDYPALAVTASVDNPTCSPWEFHGVTHIASGALVGQAVWTLESAKEIVERIGLLADWGRPILELVTDADLAREVRAVMFDVEAADED